MHARMHACVHAYVTQTYIRTYIHPYVCLPHVPHLTRVQLVVVVVVVEASRLIASEPSLGCLGFLAVEYGFLVQLQRC